MKIAAKGSDGSIIKNFLYSSLTTLLNVLVPLATYPYLARVLGPEHMGRLGVAGSFANYFIVAAGLGFATYGVRVIASSRHEKAVFNKRSTELFIVATAADVLATLAYFVTIALVPRYREDIALFALFGVTVVTTPVAIDWFFRGIEEFRFIGIRNAVIQMAYVLILFAIVRDPSDTIRYAFLLAGIAIAGTTTNLWTARRYVTLDFKDNRPVAHLSSMVVFALIAFMITAYTNLDFLFLGLLATNREAGYYSISLRLVRMITTVTATLSGVLLPRLSLLSSSQEHEMQRLLSASASAILMFALPAACGVFAVSGDLVLLFGGAEFKESAYSLRLLALIIPVVAGSNFLQMQIFIPRGRERGLLLSFSAGLLVTGVAMALLVPTYGQLGAALGVILGETAVLAVQVLLCGINQIRAILNGRGVIWYAVGAVLCGGFALLPQAFMEAGTIRLVVSVASGVLVYTATLLVVRDTYVLGIARMILAKMGKRSV